MHRAISLVLILGLVATVAVPVWASQPAPVKHTASFGVSQVADDGFRDWWKGSKVVKYVQLGCTGVALVAFSTSGAACGLPGATYVCGGCLVVMVIDKIVDWTGD